MRSILLAVPSAALLLLSAGALAISVLTLAFTLLFTESLFYFPGDPPLLDAALPYAASSFGMALLPLALTSRLAARLRWVPPRAIVGTARFLVGASAFAVLFCTAGILHRFSPAWAPVRHGIRAYSDSILASAGGDKHRVLTHEEFLLLERRFLPEPVFVPLSGFGTVRLRMAHRTYPYVGVDFGEGRNASFNLATMYCTYSD